MLAVLAATAGQASQAAAAFVGDSAPPLALHTVAGEEFRLEGEVLHHPVLLAFLSARCKPCDESRPALEKLSKKFASRNQLSLVSIFFGVEKSNHIPGEEETDSWADILLLGDDAAARSYGVFGTPVFLLVGKEGTVLWRHVGRLLPDDLEPALEAALSRPLASAP